MRSKRSRGVLICFIAIFFLLAANTFRSYAAVPQKINYQGSLKDSGGTPVNATVSILFSIYDVDTGGTALWSETQSVTVSNGVFSVNLGDVTPVNLPFDTQYYLGINVAGDGEMTPRRALTTAGYAFRADTTGGVSSYTTAQRDALTPSNGMMIYNTTNDCIEFYIAGSWKSFCEGVAAAVFNCETDQVTDVDGNSYNTVLIGSQCWMAENLNVGTMIAGAVDQTDNGTLEKYCYSDTSANCTIDGGLYQWDEMMQYVTTGGSRGICSAGWHIPTDAEWKTLEMALGMTQVQADGTGYRGTDEGTKLKQSGSSGFEGLLAGYRSSDGSFSGKSSLGYFRSSTGSGTDAWYRFLYTSYATVGRLSGYKIYGFSVRCLKD